LRLTKPSAAAGKVEVTAEVDKLALVAAAEKLVVAAVSAAVVTAAAAAAAACNFSFLSHLNNCKTINGPGSEMECLPVTCSLLHGKIFNKGVQRRDDSVFDRALVYWIRTPPRNVLEPDVSKFYDQHTRLLQEQFYTYYKNKHMQLSPALALC